MGPQALRQAGEHAGQVEAVAAVGKIGLHVADDALGRVDGLRVAGHQAPGHALGKDVVEEALEYSGGEQLAGAAHGGIPR